MRDIQEEAKMFLDYIIGCTLNEDFWTITALDHICYRAENEQEYSLLKNEFSALGTLVADNEVNGREISIFNLNTPLQNDALSTQWLELAAPKKGSNHVAGFEHIELITALNLREFIEKNTHLNFNTKNIDAFVPEIRLNFSKGVIKFRNIGIESVLLTENRL